MKIEVAIFLYFYKIIFHILSCEKKVSVYSVSREDFVLVLFTFIHYQTKEEQKQQNKASKQENVNETSAQDNKQEKVRASTKEKTNETKQKKR